MDVKAVRAAPLQRASLVSQATTRLRELIINNSLSPGTRLPQVELASKLGVSRTPLREAFRILEKEGLIRVSNGNNTLEVVKFTPVDIGELYELREVVDGLATRLLAKRGLSKRLDARLARLLKQMKLAAQDPAETAKFVAAHVDFHVAITEAAGNSRLVQFLPTIRISAEMEYEQLGASGGGLAESAREHEAIYAALKRGDPVTCEQVAREHIACAAVLWESSRSQAEARDTHAS